MENIEALFVRACKSRNSVARVKSVYRRFYYPVPVRFHRLDKEV